MNVSFYSEVLGEHDGSLVIKYENGKTFELSLLSYFIRTKQVFPDSKI